MNPGMHKWLLQMIALILVMTAALNAQCFATCAIASVAQPPDHACCPHHKSTHADKVQAPALPVALAFEIAPQLIPAPVTARADFATIAVLPPPNRPALTTTLRL
jgi:hypothetical protein